MSERATDELFGGDDVTPEPAPVETPAAESVVEDAPNDPPPAQPESAPETPPVQPQALREDRQDQLAPVRALLDERDRRKAAEAKAAALAAWKEEQERKASEAKAEIPHPLDDPDGFVQWQQGQLRTLRETLQAEFEARQTQQTLRWSAINAQTRLGPEKFGKLNEWIAKSWDQKTHAFAQRQPDPYAWAAAQFDRLEREQRIRSMEERLSGKDLDAYIAEQVAAKLAEAQASAPAPAPEPTRSRNPDGTFAAAPPEQQRHRPGSLANVNGAAVTSAGAPGSALDGLFSD